MRELSYFPCHAVLFLGYTKCRQTCGRVTEEKGRRWQLPLYYRDIVTVSPLFFFLSLAIQSRQRIFFVLLLLLLPILWALDKKHNFLATGGKQERTRGRASSSSSSSLLPDRLDLISFSFFPWLKRWDKRHLGRKRGEEPEWGMGGWMGRSKYWNFDRLKKETN